MRKTSAFLAPTGARALIHHVSYDASARALLGVRRADAQLASLHLELATSADLDAYRPVGPLSILRRAVRGAYAVDFFVDRNEAVHLVRVSLASGGVSCRA